MSDDQACENTDRELWREREGDYYADSVHVTSAGGVGINCGGTVYVKPLREWHRLAGGPFSLTGDGNQAVDPVVPRAVNGPTRVSPCSNCISLAALLSERTQAGRATQDIAELHRESSLIQSRRAEAAESRLAHVEQERDEAYASGLQTGRLSGDVLAAELRHRVQQVEAERDRYMRLYGQAAADLEQTREELDRVLTRGAL